MINVGITATACYLPEQVLSNRDVIEQFNLGIDEAWIESRTGITQRHWMVEGQTTSDMAVEVANRILAKRNIKAKQLDRIVLATISGDYPSPATAAIVAQRLGTRCPAFDISAACVGFLYGLDVGAGAVRSGERYVLVLAADARSRFINKYDRRGAVLFADGAAGVLLEPTTEDGLMGVVLGADGEREGLGAWIPAGGAKKPTTAETVANGEHFLHVETLKDIFPMFVGYVREAVNKALLKAGLTLRDIDLFIPHQGNKHLVDLIIKDLDFPAERTINNVAVHGNTSGASISIALAEAFDAGRVKRGDVVLMATVGAGNVFGAVICKF